MLSGLETGVYAGIGASGLVAGGCAYAASWPTSRLFGQALIAPRRPAELALTFDDGPNPAWTPRLLEVLAANRVRGTFFLLGRYAQREPGLVRQIVEAGHAIGNHSWSHPKLAFCGAGRVREELRRTSESLEQIAGKPVRLFRPPFGVRRPAVFRIARELGLMPAMWNAMTSDWSEPSAERIAAQLGKVIDRLRRRGWAANVVLHDGSQLAPAAARGPSVEAARRLIARYKASRQFVTLQDWA